MKIETLKKFEKELFEITILETSNPELLAELKKINLLTGDLLKLINPKRRPLYFDLKIKNEKEKI